MKSTLIKCKYPGLNIWLEVIESLTAVAKCLHLQVLMVGKQNYLALVPIYGSTHYILVAFQTVLQTACYNCYVHVDVNSFSSTVEVTHCRLQSSKNTMVGETA